MKEENLKDEDIIEETKDEEQLDNRDAECEAQEEKKTDDKDTNDKKDKKKKKNKVVEKLEEEVKNLKEIDLRRQAEWENFRKRTEKEKFDMYTVGAKEIIEKILPVLDNFERGLESEKEETPFKEGMDKIYKQFTKILEDIGVSEIPTDGEEFNPEFHNAVMQEEKEGVESGIVIETLQKGYIYREKVVRHAMVKVSC